MGRRRNFFSKNSQREFKKLSVGNKIFAGVFTAIMCIIGIIIGIVLCVKSLTPIGIYFLIFSTVGLFFASYVFMYAYTQSKHEDSNNQNKAQKDINKNYTYSYNDKIEANIIGGYPEPVPITSSQIKYDTDDLQYRRKLFNIKNEIKNSPLSLTEITNKIKEVESYGIQSKDQLISLHFFYNDVLNRIYSLRNEDSEAIDYCLQICEHDINILPKISLTNTSIPSLTRKAIILEKQHKIDEALDVCDYAIENNYFDDKKSFLFRKNRLLAKQSNSSNTLG